MVETNYRVISFGVTEHGFYNQFAWCSTIGYAQGIFNAHKSDPEADGAVVIKVQHEDWEVVEQFGTENVEVVYGPVGNHKVRQLVGV
jgi:hypothetical protein